MNTPAPGPEAMQAAQVITSYCSSRFPAHSVPVDENIDSPWFAEKVQGAIDRASHQLRMLLGEALVHLPGWAGQNDAAHGWYVRAKAALDSTATPARAVCRVCSSPTQVVVNIDFRATPVCEKCCLRITKQTVAEWLLP